MRAAMASAVSPSGGINTASASGSIAVAANSAQFSASAASAVPCGPNAPP